MKLYDGDRKTNIDVMLFLLKDLTYCNYHLFTDFFYNSYDNTKTLLEHGVNLTGTLRKRRGGPELMNVKKFRNIDKETVIPFSKTEINSFIYFDSKKVSFISSYINVDISHVKAEKYIIYNKIKYKGFTTKDVPNFV